MMKKKQETPDIVFLSPTPPPYMGPSVATQILLKSRFVREFRIHHIDTADRRSLSTLAQWDITNITLAVKHYALLFSKLVSSKSRLVYIPISQTARGFMRDLPFIVIAKVFGNKVVLHLRGSYFREFYNSTNRIMKWLVRTMLKKTDRMIVLGNCLKPMFHGLIPEKRISVVPNGLDLNRTCRKDKGVEERMKGGRFIVLFLSNLIKSKGYFDVLQAVPQIIRYREDARFMFAGEWRKDEERRSFDEYVKRERLEDNVEAVGIKIEQDKIRIYEKADLFVFPPSSAEGHPWVIVEAMAAGLPIITTNQGCIAESVIDGENGFIIPPRDPAAIADKILFLLDHPEVREKMGRRSRELYEANFTEEHFVQRMIDVIHLTLKDEGDRA
jgi:glycosyltransferase involved in cell wall biosynthesis